MRDFIFVADVNADVSREYSEREGIAILPQYYHFNDGVIYGDEIVLTSEQFYDRLKNERSYSMGCNPDRVRGILEEKLKDGFDMIVMMASSNCSGSYNTVYNVAQELLEEYKDARIYVVDSFLESIPLWMMIDRGVEMKKAGASFDEVVEMMETMKKGCDALLIVDDLKYLVRGGRLSKLSGTFGTMLNIKPILHFEDGLIGAFDKVRGTKAAKKRMIETLKTMDLYEKVIVAHTCCEEEAIAFGQELEKELGVKVMAVQELSLIIGTHTGPGVVGVGFCDMNKCR